MSYQLSLSFCLKVLIFSAFLIYLDSFSEAEAQENPFFFEFSWSNDFYYIPNPTDKHFTNGVYIDVGFEGLKRNPLNFLLLGVGVQADERYGIGFTQDIFTPQDKENLSLVLDDRPFASYLTVHAYKLTVNKSAGLRMKSEWQIGVLGGIAGGGKTQNFIHEIIPTSAEVAGWKNEIRSDFIINYNISLEKEILKTKFSQAWLGVDTRLGTLYSDFTPGLFGQVGIFDDRFASSRGWRNKRELKVFIFGGMKLRMTAYDATVRGGVFRTDQRFRDNYSSNRVQEQWELGIQVNYLHWALNLTMFQSASDLENGLDHNWGKMSLLLQY